MWRDISDEVQIKVGKLIHEGRIVGLIETGIIGVSVDGFRVRMEREYDEEGYVNRFFIEKSTAGESIPKLLEIAKGRASSGRPLLEVRNMKLLELEVGGKQIFFNMELIESFQQKTGNISILKMQSGITYEVDYNVQRIKQKIGEATKPAT